MTTPKLSAGRLHRFVAWGAFALILASVTTGLLWAYSPYLYWPTGYMERKDGAPAPPISEARVSLPEALAQAKERFGEEATPVAVTLRSDAGLVVYDVRFQSRKGKPRAALLDAISGSWRSPLSQEDAIDFARQYVVGNPPVRDVSLLRDWVHRNAKAPRAAWQVCFADPGETEIFLDPDTGEILEDTNSARRFHFWVMRIHQLNFFGTRKILTIAVGLPLLMLLGTGLRMLLARGPRRSPARKDATVPKETRCS